MCLLCRRRRRWRSYVFGSDWLDFAMLDGEWSALTEVTYVLYVLFVVDSGFCVVTIKIVFCCAVDATQRRCCCNVIDDRSNVRKCILIFRLVLFQFDSVVAAESIIFRGFV
jgi:hypothetical protein